MLPIKPNSAWDAATSARYLTETRTPLRLSVIAGNAPLIVPLWFVLEDDVLLCASKARSHIVRSIGTTTTCFFDVSTNDVPSKGVRGRGVASIDAQRGTEVLETLVARYLPDGQTEFSRWLLSSAADEVAITIRPEWITAWDYSRRMATVVSADSAP